MKKLSPSPKLGSIPKLTGESSQAPGLRQRDHLILNKALGLDSSHQFKPNDVASIAQYHPDPTVRKKAAAALSHMEFNLNPMKGK